MLADAYLPKKAKEGRIEDIMLCIYCNNGCTENRLLGRNRCAVNPELGMEAVWKIDVVDFPAFILVDDKGTDFFKKLGI